MVVFTVMIITIAINDSCAIFGSNVSSVSKASSGFVSNISKVGSVSNVSSNFATVGIICFAADRFQSIIFARRFRRFHSRLDNRGRILQHRINGWLVSSHEPQIIRGRAG